MNRLLTQLNRYPFFLASLIVFSVAVFAQNDGDQIAKDLSALSASKTVYLEGTEETKLRAIPVLEKHTDLKIVNDRSKAKFVIKIGHDFSYKQDNPSTLATKMPRLVEDPRPVPLLTTNESRTITSLRTSLSVVYQPEGATPETVWSQSRSSRISDVPTYRHASSRPFDLDPLPARYYASTEKDLERLVEELAKELER